MEAAFYENYGVGYVYLCGGVGTGIAEMACGISVGFIGGLTAMSDARSPQMFVRMLVILVFASVVGLLGLISGILLFNTTP